MATERRRWILLRDLDRWIEKPMFALSAIWLILLVIELAGASNALLEILSSIIWFIFVLEFALRFALAPAKLPFLAQNVLTIAALLLPGLRLFRIARILRFARFAKFTRGATLLRLVAGANRGMNALRRTMRRRGLGYLIALTLIVCVLGALGMRTFESTGANAAAFDTYGDSLWWTAMLLTTMGSQAWPVTPEGRILALILSVYAFAVFGYVAAALASFFVGRDQERVQPKPKDLESLEREISALREDLRRITPPSRTQRGAEAEKSRERSVIDG